MQHLGVICPSVSGHMNPMMTLGRTLQRRGYRVSVVGIRDCEAKARHAGLDFIAYAEGQFPAGRTAEITEKLGRLRGVEAFRFTATFLGDVAEATLRDAPPVIQEAGIDALLIDQVSANVVGQIAGLPYVTVCNALALHQEPGIPPFSTTWPYDPDLFSQTRNALANHATDLLLRPIVTMCNRYRAAAGLTPSRHFREWESPLATVAQQPAFFDFPRRHLPATFHYTGPFHDETSGDPVEFPFERLDGRPLLYCSLGTLQNKVMRLFRAIAEACRGLDAQLVISLGRKDATVSTDFAGDPIVVPYAPQLALLKRARLVITHAGLNTVLETLTQGVPMVAIPITNDQPGVASRLAHIGAGEFVPVGKVSASRLRPVLEKVLSTASYRESAAQCRQQIADGDGLNRAADIVEQALTTGQPVARL